jgi:hypothetical protein
MERSLEFVEFIELLEFIGSTLVRGWRTAPAYAKASADKSLDV